MKYNQVRDRILGLAALILCFAINASATGPSVSFTTFLAGSNQDQAKAVARDSAGNTYVAGFTASSDFPLCSASMPSFQGQYDAFLTKLSPSGAILFSTYWGGSGTDVATGVTVDSTGVYITGYTNSLNFPGQRYAPANGQYHAFVAKFSLSGQEIYSLVFGGSSLDEANAITVDSLQYAYIAGFTYSSDFPAKFSDSTFHGGEEAFVAKIDSNGNLIGSAYVGGSSSDWANGIAIDSSGSLYITGGTASVDFPHTMPITISAGTNTFVTKLNTVFAIEYSNVMGGGWNFGTAISADSVHTYVTGWIGPNSYFPTSVGAFQTARPSPSGYGTFVAELDSTYGERIYSSYLGGSNGSTVPTAIAVQGGNVYVAGNTSSTSFPGAPAITPNPTAGWVVKLAPQLNGLSYTTFLGASINGIAVDLRRPVFYSTLSNVEVYTAGYRFTGSTAYQSEDAFAVKLVEPTTGVSILR
jgi:Beta-propeller repeat